MSDDTLAEDTDITIPPCTARMAVVLPGARAGLDGAPELT